MLALYSKNSLLLTEDSEDAVLMRRFFGINDYNRAAEDCACTAQIDAKSVVSATAAKSGTITASSVSNVACNEIIAENAVLVNCAAKKIKAAKGAVGYNLVDESCSEEGIVLAENEVRVGVFMLDRSYFEMKSDVAKTDGGKVFKDKVHGNAFSFQEVYDMNQGTDVAACGKKAEEARVGVKSKANL